MDESNKSNKQICPVWEFTLSLIIGVSGEGVENVLDDILQGHTNEDELNTVETDNVEESQADTDASESSLSCTYRIHVDPTFLDKHV